VRLKVQASDAEAAAALLDAQATAAELNQIEVDALTAAPPKTTPSKKLSWGQIAIGFLLGLLVSLLFQGDKNPENKTYYSYTADGKCYEALIYRNGHIVKTCEDRNLDGRWDAWFYYQHGRAVGAELDENFDGEPDLFATYSNGVVASTEQDADFNGVPDIFYSYKNGVLQRVDFRPNGSKFTTTREIFTNGVLIEIRRGGNSLGFFNEVEKYDSFFNLLEIKHPYSSPPRTDASTPFELVTPLSK
jgi:antitoxin component YwqK of YwqJK toxin-antitoxin module